MRHQEPTPARSARRRLVRSLAAALASCVVLGFVAVYVVAPTRTAFAVTMQSTRRAPTGPELVYGRVTGPTGQPIARARLSLSSGGRTVASLTTGAAGTYRRRLRLRRGDYTLVLRARFAGHAFTHRMRAVLEPGRSYRVSGRLLPRRVFTFLPVASY